MMRTRRLIAYGWVIAGVAYASYSGIHYLQQVQLVQDVAPIQVSADASSHQTGSAWVIVPKNERPKQGEHFADLIIPKLKAQIPIVEGTDPEELAQGAGHFAGSVLPGEPDNAVVSGHRDTVFRRVKDLKKGDELWVRTKQGIFVYTITKMWITTPDDRTVIVPLGRPVLTLTTCYPFYYIGPAPKRYIIQATLSRRL